MKRITCTSARVAVVAALGVSTFTSVPAIATPATGFTAVQQIKGEYPPLDVDAEKTGKWDLKLNTKDNSDLWVVRNSIAGGGQSGWHTHPGPSLITVTIGEVFAYESDDPACLPKRFSAGQGFVDRGSGHVHLIQNASATVAAETVAVQFLPVGATRRIDMPQPTNSNCPTF